MRNSTARVAPETIGRTLRRVFGLKHLREGQEPVIARVLRGLPTLAVMPTGAGKSLCYQLPALLIDGRTVVVSPLIALMKDQCDTLRAHGIVAVQTHSAMPAAEAADARTKIEDGSARIVFTTPEHLADPDFQALLKRDRIGLLAVDEAHCISQWGHDFRPSFLELGNVRRALGDPTVLALTATATNDTLADITTLLDIPKSGVIASGIHRPNLHFAAEHIVRADDKLARVVAIVRAREGSGIVYAATVRAATEIHAALESTGESVGLYHGKLAASRRHASQDDFMDGRVRVMVATNAFGLGVDKPDIRFVLHYQIPPGLDAYYQESGRAGRDGEPARCILLFADGDKSVQSFFLGGRYPGLDDFRAVCAMLRRPPQPGADDRAPAWTDESLLEAVGRENGRPARKCAVALSVLRQQGLVEAADGGLRLTQADLPLDALRAVADGYRDRGEQDRATLESMVAYAQSGRCRWRLLLEHFGETPAFDRCNTCDNCLRLAAHEAQSASPAPFEVSSRDTVQAPSFARGDRVRTRRHGDGEVVAADGLSVTVAFGNGEQRSFQPQFVRKAGRRRPAGSAIAAPAA